MGDLLDYILLLTAASAALALAEGLAPKRQRAAISFCLGVYLLYTMVAPLPALARTLSGALGDFGVSGGGTEGGEVYYETALEAAEAGLRCAVAEEFEIKEENISVKILGLDTASLTAERIYITLSRAGALADTRAIEEYAEKIFGGDEGGAKCTVDVRLG